MIGRYLGSFQVTDETETGWVLTCQCGNQVIRREEDIIAKKIKPCGVCNPQYSNPTGMIQREYTDQERDMINDFLKDKE
jgi:hypothetical protein